MEALQANGISPEEASAAATLAMAVFFALFNGLGRIVWGMISDKIGEKLNYHHDGNTGSICYYCFNIWQEIQ